MFSASKTTGPSGYNLTNSLRLRSSASAYLTRTLGSASSRTTWTYSFWIKRGLLGGTYYILSNGNGNINQTEESLYFESTDQLTFINVTQNVAVNWAITTTQVFRDPSAWYHFVIAVDTTQATASNRIKFYVNGNQITAFSSASYPAQNANTTQGASGLTNEIGRRAQVANNYFDGYYDEFHFVTGQALTPSSFGSTNATTGVWQPARYTGSYGTNGFYLNFTNIGLTSGSNTGLGRDFSGNGNFFNTNNISVTDGITYDSMFDVPTLTSRTQANYAVLNPLKTPNAGTYSNANLTVSTNTLTPALATIYPLSGKWYWEVVWVSGSFARIGVQNTNVASTDFGADTAGWRWESNTGNIFNNTILSTVATYANGDVLGFCLDCDAGRLYVSKNGTWQNSAVPASGTGAVATNIPTNTPMSPAGSTGTATTVIAWNFGQRAFAYTPPSGFVALNTFNLPNSTIVKGNTVMDATVWTGNGVANRTIVNAGGFRPDLVWTKGINTSSWNHFLNDSVRGFPNFLISSSTAAQATTSPNIVTSAASNGFVIENNGNSNNSGSTYVGWQWQAGQGSTSSNTSGSITSTVSVNTTAGFSIVTYTGTGANATVGHGLGVAPRMIICKNRASATDWAVYHASVGNTGALRLNLTAATETDSRYWNNTTPTSTVFSVGSSSTVNGSSNTQVAYCWAAIPGFSAFGSYTGNGSADGPFIYTGFRPEFILVKITSTTDSWAIHDTSRSPYNTSLEELYPNLTNAESTGASNAMDILSNGFKLRGTSNNTNGATFIYAAFAENPFKNALAR